MGVPHDRLPAWDDIQIVTSQLARRPLLDEPVGTDVTIGASADAPLRLDIPLFVSDMSFGALSQEAKVALARGAERAGTGICSGEGGMLDEERQENSRYFYELASAKFGWSLDKVRDVQAFHFKLGQGAKTGTGVHLPGRKVVGRIAEVRELAEGTDAVSPATFTDLRTIDDFRDIAAQVRKVSGGIPIGAKLSALHIEDDIDAALAIGVDYIKALALGADAVAISNWRSRPSGVSGCGRATPTAVLSVSPLRSPGCANASSSGTPPSD